MQSSDYVCNIERSGMYVGYFIGYYRRQKMSARFPKIFIKINQTTR
jgi:hypothetical protein